MYCPHCGMYFEDNLDTVFMKVYCKGCGTRFEVRKITPLTFDELKAIVQSQGRIWGIKRLREDQPGFGLKEAKEVVDILSGFWPATQ